MGRRIGRSSLFAALKAARRPARSSGSEAIFVGGASVGEDITASTGLTRTGNDIALSDAELLALRSLTSATDKLPYFTGSGTAALADLSSFIRGLLDDANSAAARATLGIDPGTWTAVAGGVGFGTGWGNFGDPWAKAAYRKDWTGRVFLRGLVARTSGSGTLIFTLPSGFRPASNADCLFGVHGGGIEGRVDIKSDGTVNYAAGGVNYFQLDGLAFDIA